MRGGLAAGILFVLPGALVMLGLSLIYALGHGVPLVDGALFGIKAAVLVIVVEALIRIGRRALKTDVLMALAAAAFIGIFFLALPFPLIVIGAGADRLSGRAQRARSCSRSRPSGAYRAAASRPLAAGGDARPRSGSPPGGRRSRSRRSLLGPEPCAGRASARSSPSSRW